MRGQPADHEHDREEHEQAADPGHPGRDQHLLGRVRRPAPRWLRVAVLLACVFLLLVPVAIAADGQVTWGVHTMLVPSYFDPSETIIGTSFMVLYGVHDALVKPLPGKGVAPALAESWTVSPDGLVYDFVLRKGIRFHNGEAVTADDVKFSFERYRGASHKILKDRVAEDIKNDEG